MNRYEILNQERQVIRAKKRVAAYCRVSTDHEDQANSFESQQRYFRQYIEHHPDWELYEIFADEGLSGTSTRKRKAFKRMIESAEQGAFDLILTKEISRFARNTLDSIYYTRELKRFGVGVIFMNDGINTLDGDAELRLAIMSSIAQEESRKTSERVKWGQKRQMEQGVVFGRSMLGYDVKNGRMTMNEEGARLVRHIFHKFVNEGKGTHVIARELREEGFAPMRGKAWSNTVILRLLRNEKYCGDLVQKKTYTPDFLSHEKKYNRGQEEFVILKDHHEPIVSREIFDAANRILDSRALSPAGQAKHSNRYAFSGKIKCGCCGSSYVARHKTRKDGSQYKAWRCYEASRNGMAHIDCRGNKVGCSAHSIRDEDILRIMQLVCRELRINREMITRRIVSIAESVIAADENTVHAERLEERLRLADEKQSQLLDLYMSADITKQEWMEARARCEREIRDLQISIERLEKHRELILDIKAATEQLTGGLSDDEDFYGRILDKIIVRDDKRVEVRLNMLPFRWCFAASQAARLPSWSIPDASVPISVSSPLSSG